MERHTHERKMNAGSVKVTGTPGNGLPPLKPYVHRGDETGMPEAEVQARIAAARARARALHPEAQEDGA